jgi:hypothetical protein
MVQFEHLYFLNTEGTSTLTTYYFAGGSYEIQTDGSTETIRQYYSIAGTTVAMRSGTTWNYFLTDHFSSSRMLCEVLWRSRLLHPLAFLAPRWFSGGVFFVREIRRILSCRVREIRRCSTAMHIQITPD